MRTKLAKGKKVDPSTWLQTETMKFIGDHGNPKMKDIADYLSITAPSTTSLVGGLSKSGLVICRADKHDRRTSRIVLTKKGNADLKRAVTRATELLSKMFAVLSETELAAFIGALNRIKEKSVEGTTDTLLK